MRAESVSTLAFSLLLSCNASPTFHGSKIDRKAEDAKSIPSSVELLFNAGQTGHINMQATPERLTINQDLTFAALQIRSEKFQQTDRPFVRLEKMQGYDGSAFEETIPLKEAGNLDLLIVIDDSQTMERYQELLSSRLEPLLSQIGNSNWRIAIVTTTDSCQRDVLTKEAYLEDRNAVLNRFAYAAKAGINGDPIERGIEMAIKGFTSKKCRNLPAPPNPWIRPDSERAVLIVSDEENCGSASNEGCNANSGYPHFGVADFKKAMPDSKVFGFLGFDVNSCRGGFAKDPIEYRQLVSETGGLWEPICQEDYGPVLGRVSEHVGRRIKREIPLAGIPDPGSLRIFIAGQPYTGPWELDGKILKIKGQIETTAEEMEVKYDVGAVARWTDFEIGDTPNFESTKVFFGEREISPDEYEYDAVTHSINFNEIPPDGMVVRVLFRKDMPLQREFILADQPVVHTASVKVDGRMVRNYAFNPDSNAIIFQDPPSDNSTITIAYVRPGDLVLEYAAATNETNDVVEVVAKDTVSRQELAVTYDGRSLFFSESLVTPGKQVSITYNTSAAAIELQHEPMERPVVQQNADMAELCDFDRMISEQRHISLECAGGILGTVTVDYDYLIRFQNTFPLEGHDLSYYNLSVYLDGRRTKNFELIGNNLVIPEQDLTPWTQVQVALVRKELSGESE